MKITEGGIYPVNEKIDQIVQASWRRPLARILKVSVRISILWPNAMAENFSWFTLVPPGKLGDSISDYNTTTSTSFPIYFQRISYHFVVCRPTDNVVKYTIYEEMQKKMLIDGGKENTVTQCHLLSCHAIRFVVRIACPLKHSDWCVCVRVCVCNNSLYSYLCLNVQELRFPHIMCMFLVNLRVSNSYFHKLH
jgi:hypothetical protein